MGVHYTIDCNHCGGHTEYMIMTNGRTPRSQQRVGQMHIDTECAMRCPVCRARLNNTEEEFYSQVHMEFRI